MIHCAVIDDEPLARECIVDYIGKVDFLNLIGTGSNPTELSKISDKNPIDLIFLDIQMPIMSGIDYLKSTRRRPMVTITTAYPDHALEGFELDVLDYLVKPITFNRFFKSALKAKDYYSFQNRIQSKEETNSDYFFIKCENVFERIYFNNIEFVHALQNYIVIHTLEKKYITLMTMKRIKELLGDFNFVRTHKSYIVAVDKITSISNSQLTLGKGSIPISRNYKSKVLQRVVGKNLWKK